MRGPLGLVIVLLLLIPSAAYLWLNDDLPQFCDFHDDCIFFVSAKSLASGHYRIESLPGQPAQTKYPPLYPLLLSLAWRIVPEFPNNLPVAAWISWIAFPCVLILFARYTPRLGLEGWRSWTAVALLAINPYVIWFGSQLLSELWYMALLFALLTLIEDLTPSRAGWALAIGALGGVSYLVRSAGIAILPAAFVYLWLKKQRVQAAWFAAGMLPFVLGWNLWARANLLHTADPALIYYLDYAAYEKINISFNDFHLYLWKNADGLLLGLGSLVQPKITSSLFLKILAQVIAVAMISGVARLYRQGHAQLYAMFAIANSALLLIWHFPPDERFVLPMFPLALAGLIAELEHFTTLLRASLRHQDAAQRVVARGMIGAAMFVFGGSLALQIYVAAVLQPAAASEARIRTREQKAAFDWLHTHAPAPTGLLAYSDPKVYLYTGNPVLRQSLLPDLWYHEDHAGTVALWGNLAPFAREHGLKYFVSVPSDLGAVSDEDRDAIEKARRESTAMTKVFEQGSVKIYKFADALATSSPPNTPPRPTAQ